MEKTNNKKQAKMLTIFIILILIIDQISKFIAYKYGITKIPSEDAQNNNGYYIVMALLVIIIIIRYISSNNTFIKLDSKIILSFAIAGAIGNTIDRIFRGYVVDFIKIGNSFYINLSYICIAIAWIGMAVILTKNTMKFIKERNSSFKNRSQTGKKEKKMKIIINEQEEGKRIDSYISSINNDLSRSTVQRLIEEGNITVNSQKVKDSYKLKLNDEIEITIPEVKEIDLKAQDIPLEILYEDNDIIVVNKPKGMVVHPGNGNLDGTLVNAVMAICKDSLSGIGGELRPGIVHRLDKDTSGAIIVAKNDKAHIALSEALKNHEIKKTYIALVRGIIKENEATINMPIARSKNDRKKMAVDKNGKEAITHFKVLKRYDNKYTLLEINIETGRTHQIRVHLSNIGYPIVGDEVYSNGKNEWQIKGQCLHAKSLDFKHPITGEKMHVEADLPEYFKKIIEELENQ